MTETKTAATSTNHMPIPVSIVKEAIEKSLPGAQVSVRDLVGDGDHLQAIIISAEFEGKSLLQQHQAVLNPLREALKQDLHALTIKTYTPQQWEKENS